MAGDPEHESKLDPSIEAIDLAESLLRLAIRERSSEEAKRMRSIALLVESKEAKAFSMLLTDRIERAESPRRAALIYRQLLRSMPPGEGFSPIDRFLLHLGSLVSHLVPGLVIPKIRERLRLESSGVILNASPRALSHHLSLRRGQGFRVNLNRLGEAVLGEEEAGKRLEAVLNLLQRDDVDYVSVKISAIFSQIDLTAYDRTLDTICSRLRSLYRAALPGGKFVNLDMEEFRDLDLTVSAFTRVLEEPEFLKLSAGIVLQAYLPDSIQAQKDLTRWAKERHEKGGAPIKLRIVKGANLAMERVEAEIHGWNPAPFSTKHETDTYFKHMLEYACEPENARVVRLGVASHNLFDVALALVLRRRNNIEEWIEIEMLEGMAPAQARAVRQTADSLLLYAPVVAPQDYGSALAYLVRRLDENTAPGNFLASLFSLRPDSASWVEQKDRFIDAWRDRNEIRSTSHRSEYPFRNQLEFSNEPDTDWTRADSRQNLGIPTPMVEPSESDRNEIESVTERAENGRAEWAALPPEERSTILRRCGDEIASKRFEAIALLRDEGKKSAAEADPEVSEAADFCRYYAEFTAPPSGAEAQPLGAVLVTPPWNFPLAIPCGGVIAALAAGNTVILKPAPEVVRIGLWLVQRLWAAGVPRSALHFIACADGSVGRALIEDPRVSAIVLTGAYETARKFRDWRPSVQLLAETSGKNAIVVSATSDREVAIRDLVRSAFGHSGQKCSAASLGILEEEVYDDPAFRRQLHDAASSLRVGPADEPGSIVTPLVQSPGDELLRALTRLDPGEEWLLQPREDPETPNLWSPGIRLGVTPASWFHQTECFGPVLGLMRAPNLEKATEWQNSTPFGLTAGFHSLDELEIETWKARAEAGNLYINRGITGAIVRRQPFGGWKKSSVGPGAKAGGPNYVNQFRQFCDESGSPQEVAYSYQLAWDDHFSQEHDPSDLRAESNRFRYRPCHGVLLRIDNKSHPESESRARTAAAVCGVPLTISRASEESEACLAERIPVLAPQFEFLRTTGTGVGDALLRAAASFDLNWIDAPILAEGRLELTRWTREQTVSQTRHRYGNILAPNS